MDELMRRYSLSSIDVLKVDIEGAEQQVSADSAAWIDRVGAIIIELHEAIAPGRSRSFYRATIDFDLFSVRGENVLVSRSPADGLAS